LQSTRRNPIPGHPLRFLLRVASGFRSNQGFLLAGAVAYYTLLSVVPLTILLLVLLSHVVPEPHLLHITGAYLEVVVPGKATALLEQVQLFVEHKNTIGGVGLVMLLFFSSMAFTALENAMGVIFFHRLAIRRRHFLVSALIPYLYILAVGAGLLLVSVVSGLLQGTGQHLLALLGVHWSPGVVASTFIYLLGVVGQILLLTSLYMVMPVGRLAWRHALSGGIAAGISWEITRHVLVWYFANLSLVNVVYGSFATTIVILLSFEIGSLILLLGAQVIAEFERSTRKRASA
jgi:membrane protein